MKLTEQDILNLLSTQRLINENFQLRDVVQELSEKLAKVVQQLDDYKSTANMDDI